MKQSILMKTITLSAVLLGVVAADAADLRIRLNLDQHSAGQSTILLKQEIKKENPNLNLQNYELVSVRLMAKSAAGHGTAELFVDGRSEDMAGIPQANGSFQVDRPRSFNPVELESRSRAQGPWQIELRGNIKVNTVIVILDQVRRAPPVRPQPPIHPRPPVNPQPPILPQPPINRGSVIVDLGEERAEKIVSSTETFYSRQPAVKNVILEGSKETTDIQQVLVTYGNGEVESLPELVGHLREGKVKIAHINGRNIEKIQVTATAASLFGSRPKYKVKLEVYN